VTGEPFFAEQYRFVRATMLFLQLPIPPVPNRNTSTPDCLVPKYLQWTDFCRLPWGKTTALRTIAGIFEPVHGRVVTRGRISPMFDINLGIDADLSGFDNIRIRGLLLGLSPRAIEQFLPEIVEFTELGDYLDMPVRTYSAGMILRLSFAVATCFKPEILLMDEWILAGDAHFMGKAEARVQGFVERANLMVLASHNLELCRRWCTMGIWFDQGRIREQGPIDSVIRQYQKSV
jgi:homopolymeric O-antigen transport system ATP-binding protein